jgi:hypothetical protein
MEFYNQKSISGKKRMTGCTIGTMANSLGSKSGFGMNELYDVALCCQPLKVGEDWKKEFLEHDTFSETNLDANPIDDSKAERSKNMVGTRQPVSSPMSFGSLFDDGTAERLPDQFILILGSGSIAVHYGGTFPTRPPPPRNLHLVPTIEPRLVHLPAQLDFIRGHLFEPMLPWLGALAEVD